MFGDRDGGDFVLEHMSIVLQCLDADSTIGRVVVFVAANTPSMIDTIFLRPRRFERVHVRLPSTGEREAILRVHEHQMSDVEIQF